MDSRLQTALRLMAALGSVLAPAMTAQMALAQSAYGQVSSPTPYVQPERALRPAPDADSGQPVRYSGMQDYDRYGGETRHAPAASTFAGPTAAFTGPMLSWSGKVADPATLARRASFSDVQTLHPPMPHGAAAAPPAPPRSIYDRPPPVAQPPASSFETAQAPIHQGPIHPTQADNAQADRAQADRASADGQGETGPHHYSVHRDYGMEPDPIPLPPQFFGATADLSQPTTGDPIRRTTTTGGKAQNPLQPTDGQ